ncbi:MAG: hypothetical protein SCK28_01570 [Bacillota bacterium]|nr:hypothetical protein [Bacillota bacterium]
MREEKLLLTVHCPECGQLHRDPECFYLDEVKLADLQVKCPIRGRSFPFKSLSPAQINQNLLREREAV